jgi:diguanylate cyclase (GGDEF)-like protein
MNNALASRDRLNDLPQIGSVTMQRGLKSDRPVAEGRRTRARIVRKQRQVKGEAPALEAEAPPADKPDHEQFEYFLAHLAHYDVLTDLPNRAQFHDRLSGTLARAARQKYLAGILLLNLDHFKSVNVKHGHKQGDALLKQVAERIKKCTRKSDTLARLGGDEFAVILEALDDKQGAIIPAQRVLDALREPLTVGGIQIEITATIGIAVFPVDAQDLDGMLRTADSAMCDAKDHQRDSYRFYSPELDFKTQRDEVRRSEIEARLATLTPREREVLDVLIAGKANKMIAYLLGTSTRTIEHHRAHIMAKMQASSIAELVRMLLDHRGAPPAA